MPATAAKEKKTNLSTELGAVPSVFDVQPVFRSLNGCANQKLSRPPNAQELSDHSVRIHANGCPTLVGQSAVGLWLHEYEHVGDRDPYATETQQV